LYIDEGFTFHLWHGGVTELVGELIVSGAADQWPEIQEDRKRSMTVPGPRALIFVALAATVSTVLDVLEAT
jgi:hypothetical protein